MLKFPPRPAPVLALLGLLVLAATPRAQVSWVPIGPGGGGWMSTITVLDDTHHTIYAGCDVGGIYKSIDGGRTWEIKNNGLGIYYVQDIAYDPQTRTTLYAATRGGIYKSTDGGDHWTAKRSGFPPPEEFTFSAPISDIVVDPVHPEVVYAGVGVPRGGYELDSYHWQSAGLKGSIFKSTDSGESWTVFRNTGIDTTAMIYSLAIDSGNTDILYAATSTGIYRSSTAGAAWAPRNTGLPHGLTMGLALDPDNPDTIFTTLWAEPGSATWQGGVYRSTDGGQHWAARNDGLPQVMGVEAGFTCNYPCLVLDRQHPGTLYVGNNPWTPDPGIYKTTDGGEHWTWVSRPDSPGQNTDLGWITEHGLFVMCLAMDPLDSDRLFFGTSTHLLQTSNGGDSWEQVYSDPTGGGYWRGRGLETTCVQDIVVDPTDSGNIYVGYWDMGFLKSTDGGDTFKRTFAGMNYHSNTFSILVDPASPGTIYAATGWWETNEGEVCRSVDHGENWAVLGNGLPDAQVWSLAMDRTSPPGSRILYAASYDHGVYKTTDGGLAWFPASNGLGVDGNLQVKKIVVDPGDPDVLYAGIEVKHLGIGDESTTIQGGLFKSLDAGLHWARVDLDLPQIDVQDIAVDPGDSRVVYSAVTTWYDHSLHETFHGGVYKSTDGGISWTNNTSGFGPPDNLDVTALAISPAGPDIIYAVTSDDPYHDRSSGRGIFKSIDAGLSWSPVNDGLGVLYFSTISVDPAHPERLYAGSDGNGVWLGIDSAVLGSPGSDLPAEGSLQVQNIPNPFNPRTVIRFALEEPQEITLRIFDLEGKLVRTLIAGRRGSGTHSVTWSGKNDRGERVASGLYFCRLTSAEGTQTRKMTLVK